MYYQEAAALLERHALRYPAMEARDAVKLLYQSDMGPGHMAPDAQTCLARLEQECAQIQTDPHAPLFERIGGGMARLNLRASRALSLGTVSGMFRHTANVVHGDRQSLMQSLDALEALRPDAAEFLRDYRAQGCPAVSHSPRYRELYRPAYRVVLGAFETYLPLFECVDALLKHQKRVNIAIEGRCSAGKSSLAALLEGVYGANVFHMDDYFLPFARKTPERLAQPGGNVDYERFAQEIAGPLAAGARQIVYRPYDCGSQSLAPERCERLGCVTAVEGVYCLHPALPAPYDVRVFMNIQPQLQSERILHRNGIEMHRRFVREWIPLEEHYMTATFPQNRCNLRFEAEAGVNR